MNKKIYNSIEQLFTEESLIDYKSYYISLCKWIINNYSLLGKENIERNRLNIFINLDINDYEQNISNNSVEIKKEKKKICKYDYSIDGLLMIIHDTLWNIVMIESDISCSNCKYGDTRYVSIINKKGRKKILVECADCGQLTKLNGEKNYEKFIQWRPAKKIEINAFINRRIV